MTASVRASALLPTEKVIEESSLWILNSCFPPDHVPSFLPASLQSSETSSSCRIHDKLDFFPEAEAASRQHPLLLFPKVSDVMLHLSEKWMSKFANMGRAIPYSNSPTLAGGKRFGAGQNCLDWEFIKGAAACVSEALLCIILEENLFYPLWGLTSLKLSTLN